MKKFKALMNRKVWIFKVRYLLFATLVLLITLILSLISKSGFYSLLRNMLHSAIPLALVALGGLYSERSGVVNIALEGIMMFGAFVGILVLNNLQHAGIDGQHILLLTVLIGGVAGILFSLLHAFAAINLKSDQTISGTALNMLAVGLAFFVGRALASSGTEEITFADSYKLARIPLLEHLPFFGDLLFRNVYIITLLGLVIFIIGALIAYKTKFGLRLRACGENPHAADAAGVNVKRIRYFGVGISGLLAGMGGVILIIPTTTSFRASVYGYGFLALAVLISGQWKPARVLLFAIFFGFLMNLVNGMTLVQDAFLNLANKGGNSTDFYLGVYDFLKKMPKDIINMIPFVVTLIILAFTSKKSSAPRAAGEPYDQGKR